MTKFTRLTIVSITIFAALLWILEGHVVAEPDASPHAPEWTAEASRVLVSNSAHIAKSPALAVSTDGSKIVVGYRRQVASEFDNDLYYAVSTNNGVSWSAAQTIYQSPITSGQQLALAFSGNTAHAVWIEDIALAYARESQWASNTFTTISNPAEVPGASNPALVINGNTIDVVWSEGDITSDPIPDIYHIRSIDGGVSWTAKQKVADTQARSRVPIIALDPNNSNKLYVVWEELGTTGTIYFAQGTASSGTDTTVTWSSSIEISGSELDYRQPDITASSSGLHVAFSNRIVDNEDEYNQVFYMSCANNCTQSTQWHMSPYNPISNQVVAVNGSDPFFIIPKIIKYGDCIFTYYHGIDTSLEPNELIWGTNSCDNWSASEPEKLTSPNSNRSVNPVIATGAGDWIFMAYNRIEDSQRRIYFASSQDAPEGFKGVFMPIIRRK
ncbi:MAG: hypothetical protein H6660_04560 [Ardenticatenaceae bacterium]|nr:hypothetical protein [Ardenticatenaceae bacterium]